MPRSGGKLRVPNKTSPPSTAALDPVVAAKRAQLRYVHDAMPGITRHKARNGFDFRLPEGALVRDIDALKRIRSLAIPPAWRDVWICLDPDGHLQATGRDARSRKQYRYHPRWREVRDEAKYDKLLAFSRALPLIRARVDQDLKRRGLPREKVMAAIVRLLETTLFRIGNIEYAKNNKSFGLTTLRDRHVAIDGSQMHIRFRGKGGKEHETNINDRRLVRVIKHCRDLPGYELFQYLDEDGNRHSVGSAEVNEYLREITGADVTAKDFRTWAGTQLAAELLQEYGALYSDAARRKAVIRVVETVAKHLGNTPTICRRCYVHPAVLDGYLDGTMLQALAAHQREFKVANLNGVTAAEAAIAAFLGVRLGEPIAQNRQDALDKRALVQPATGPLSA